jgi:hypothetical protein
MISVDDKANVEAIVKDLKNSSRDTVLLFLHSENGKK